MNQESEQDLPPPQQQIPTAHEYGGGSDSLPVPLLNLNGGGFTVLQLPQPPTSTSTSSAIADPAIKPPLRKCSSCGLDTSAKKRSQPPSSPFSSPLSQPCSKRPAISNSSPDPTPPSSSERKSQWSPLRRSLSDFPCSPPPIPIGGAYYYQDFPNPAAATSSSKMNPLSPSQMLLPGNSKISPIPILDSFQMTTMVPGQQLLHRSPSNPSSSSEYYDTPAVNTTPPRPRPPPPFVRPQMFDHHQHASPKSKKLRRELKGKFEELMQLMGQPDSEQQQQQDDDDAAADVNVNCIDKAQQEQGEMMMNQNENEKCKGGHNDSVWVKQTEGGGLILHFKCSCGDAYEVFLHEDKCYYRLA